MAEMKIGPEVNNGSGLYDNEGLIDTLIVDCEELVKCVISGQGISFCAKAVEMVQKLSNLKRGVKNDMDDLRRQIRESGQREDMLQERVNELEHALVRACPPTGSSLGGVRLVPGIPVDEQVPPVDERMEDDGK